jgi:hypothetical protein
VRLAGDESVLVRGLPTAAAVAEDVVWTCVGIEVGFVFVDLLDILKQLPASLRAVTSITNLRYTLPTERRMAFSHHLG